jgi:rhamnosyltransferase subunit B
MRIVFASLGSLGDLHPLLALARGSIARGHSVTIAAGEAYGNYVGSLGFSFLPLRPDFNPDPSEIRRQYDGRRGPERLLRDIIFGHARQTYEDLLNACKNADVLVVGELLYVAPLVAAKLGIPWANVILSPTSFLSAIDPCVLAPAPALHGLKYLGAWTHRLIFAYGRRETDAWSQPLYALQRELGFPKGANPVFEGKHSPCLVLAGFPEFFAKPQADWPRNVVQTGFPFFGQPEKSETAGKICDFIARGEAPLVFTLGSGVVYIASDFYQTAASAVKALGCRAIFLLGKNPAPEGLNENFLAVDYAPLASVLPHARAIVHQGGVGGCAEALRAGIPSLVIPFGYDQPDNGERLRRLGVARVLSRKRISPDTLLHHLRQLMADIPMATRAREFPGKIHPAQELEKSIAAIEQLGDTHKPQTKSP